MARRQVHVRVRLDSGETIEALVLEWLSYPDRALVQLPSRQRPSVVRLNAVTGLYSPRSLPVPSPRLAVALAGLVAAGSLLGLLIPTSRPARSTMRAPAAVTSWTPQSPPAPESLPGEPAPLAPSISVQPDPPRPVPPPLRLARRPAPSPAPVATPNDPSRPPAAPVVTEPPPRLPQTQPHPEPAPPNAVRYEARLAALSTESAHRGAYACRCGATFHDAQELEAHRTGAVYACVRYPKCQVTSTSPDTILKHYEKDRNSGGRCWLEALRLGSAYAVVKRPACRTLAADPNRRKVIKVRVRPNFPNTDDSPWR